MIDINELNIYRTDKTKPILENIQISVNNNECISIIGNNGSGKSTLAFSLIGLIPSHYIGSVSGSFTIDDIDIFSLPFEKRIEIMSYVFQDTESQILFGTVADILGLNEKERDEEVICKLVNIFDVSNLLNKKSNELSSGESQKIALISALRNNPQLIIYDEATSALDPKIKKKFKHIIDYLLNRGKYIILLSQNEESLREYSTQVFYLPKKENIENAPPFLNQEIIDNLYQTPPSQIIEHILIYYISHSYKNWENSLIVENLEINQGETIAVIGENGSGKSTFINSLIGFIKANKISMNYSLKDLKEYLYISFASPGIQLCEATIEEELRQTNRNINFEYISKYFPFLELEKDPFELSFGQQKMLILLQSIISNKQILIFDEPEMGIDNDNLNFIKKIFSYNLKHKNRIIIYITHSLELAKYYSSRIIKFSNGSIEYDEMNSDEISISTLNDWFGL
jgi:energy-coupling factor transport system ATP-binding protein